MCVRVGMHGHCVVSGESFPLTPPISVKNISHEVNSYKRKILLLILQMFGFPDGGHIALDIILNMLRGVRIIFVC